MASLKHVGSVIALSSLMVLVAACGGAAPPAAQSTKAPEKSAAAPASAAQPSSGGEILIGMNVPMTGAAATEGEYFKKAVMLAEKQINAAGGINGKKVKVAPEDNQSSNPGALTALQKSIEDKALAILGPIKSTQIQAMSDAVKAAGIPTMIGGTNATLTKQGNPWLFRFRPDDSLVTAAMVQYIKEELKLTKVGILHDQDAYGAGAADLVEENIKKMGLTLAKREKYRTGDRDHTAQMLSLKSAGAEVMVAYIPNAEDDAIIMREYKQLGQPFKYLNSPLAAGALDLAKESAEGLLAMADYVPGQTDVAKKYAADYKQEYKEEIDAISAWNYDALNILASAIKKGGENRDKIREAILGTQGYVGAVGTFNFTPNGDGLSEVSVTRIENGKQNLVKVVKVSQ